MRAPPTEYNSAFRSFDPDFAALGGLVAQRLSVDSLAFYAATETVALPGAQSSPPTRLNFSTKSVILTKTLCFGIVN